MSKKIVYIAHPISGNVKGNLLKIQKIVREICFSTENIIPFVPYYSDLMALDENNPEERARGIANDQVYFERGVMDELWLFGPRVSEGMRHEIKLAKLFGIPVISKSDFIIL